MHLLRIARCASVPQILCPFSKKKTNEFRSLYVQEYATCLPGILQYGERTFTTSFSFFCWADCQSFCASKRIFTEFASRFRNVIFTNGKCQESHNGFVHFLLMQSLHGLRGLFPDGLQPLRAFTFIFTVAEITSVSSCALSFRYPLIAYSLLHFQSDGVPFASVFRWCSCLDSFMSGLKFFRLLFSDPYISLPWSATYGSAVLNYVGPSPVRIIPIRF